MKQRHLSDGQRRIRNFDDDFRERIRDLIPSAGTQDRVPRSSWSTRVCRRDKWKCRSCGKKVSGYSAHAHHLYSRKGYDEVSEDPNNGVCMCVICHMAFHDKYGYGNNTPDQFDKFVTEMRSLKITITGAEAFLWLQGKKQLDPKRLTRKMRRAARKGKEQKQMSFDLRGKGAQ